MTLSGMKVSTRTVAGVAAVRMGLPESRHWISTTYRVLAAAIVCVVTSPVHMGWKRGGDQVRNGMEGQMFFFIGYTFNPTLKPCPNHNST